MKKFNHQYYPAMLLGGAIFVAPVNIDRNSALQILSFNSKTAGVFAVSESYARGLCSSLGGIARPAENHNTKSGYWYHYHANSAPLAHCWFVG